NLAAVARAGRMRGRAGRGPAEGAAAGVSTRCAAGGPSAEGRSSSAMDAKVSALRAEGQAQEADQRRGAERTGGGASGGGARLLRNVDGVHDVLAGRTRPGRALAERLARLADPALHRGPGLTRGAAARFDGVTRDLEPLVELLADVVHRVHDGVPDLPERVLGVAAEAERSLADARARLAPRPGRHEQRDPGAEQRAEEEGRHAAGAALHHVAGVVLVLGHDSSFAVVVRRRPVRACAAQRAAGSATYPSRRSRTSFSFTPSIRAVFL